MKEIHDDRQDGGPAFPFVIPGTDSTGTAWYHGMTVRDYFAAKAMHAELVTAGALEGPADALVRAADHAGRTVPEQLAFNAYLMADAMLKAREAQP